MSNQQPYSKLVPFGVSGDLRNIVFATRRDTRNCRNILEDARVALLIDNRRNDESDLATALAITALGIASEITGDRSAELMQSYLDRHRSLAGFL